MIKTNFLTFRSKLFALCPPMKTSLPLFKGADIHIYIHIDLSIFALYLKKAYHVDIISYYQL